MVPRKKVVTETPAVEETVAVEAPIAVEEKKVARSYEKDDLIRCESITPGELLMIGKKTDILYKFAGSGDIVEVEYQDLVAAKITHSEIIYGPKIIVLDEALVAGWKDVQEVYDNMYTVSDLEEILTLSPTQIKDIVKNLPEGAKNSIKTLAATNIQNGKLDSIKRVSALDEVLGTNLLVETELFG